MGHQVAPTRLKTIDLSPRWIPRGPKDGLKMAQHGSKSLKLASRWPRIVPRWAQDCSRSQDVPRWLVLTLLGRAWGPKLLKKHGFFKVSANAGFWYLQALDGPFRLILAPPWAVLGLCWAVLGLSWGCLGAVLGCLGVSWACLGAVLGLSWACLGSVLGCLGLLWGSFGPVLGWLGPYTPQDASKMAPNGPR